MTWQPITNQFHADLEPFYSHDAMRWRPKAVRAWVGGPYSDRKRTVSTSVATVGLASGVEDGKIADTEAGHLIALELGGADHAANLVPMYGEVNRGTYRAHESALGLRIKSATKPAMLVTVDYPPLRIVDAGDYRVPASVSIYFFTGVDDLATLTPQPTNLVATVTNTRIAPARMVISGSDIALRRELMEIKRTFPTLGWTVEKVHGDISKGLPPVKDRPNAWLDFLVYSHEHVKIARALLTKVPHEVFTIGGYQGFRDSQRALVNVANRMTQPDERIGECWTDAPGEDPIKRALTALGTDDGIHVDHIVPEASGGWNVYSNAAVVSSLFNKQKGR